MKLPGDAEYIEDLPNEDKVAYLLHQMDIQQGCIMTLLRFFSEHFTPENSEEVSKDQQAILHIANHFAKAQNKLSADSLAKFNKSRQRIIT